MKTKSRRSIKARTIVTYHGRVPAYQREIENLEDEIQKLKRTRLPDSQFPMLMDKETLKDYLGIKSWSSIESLIVNDGLDQASFSPKKLGRKLFNKVKVNQWLEGL